MRGQQASLTQSCETNTWWGAGGQTGAAATPSNFQPKMEPVAEGCAGGWRPVATGGGGVGRVDRPGRAAPLCDIPSGCCSFTGPWTVTHSSLRMLRRVATFCRPLRPVLLLVSFPRSRSPVVGVLGLC